MIIVNITDLALGIYLTFLLSGVSALFWARMNRLDARMDRLEGHMHGMGDRLEGRIDGMGVQMTGMGDRLEGRIDGMGVQMTGMGVQMTGLVTKDDWALLRREMQDGFQRTSSEMAIMRSDLTHVALAVGAKPRASEG